MPRFQETSIHDLLPAASSRLLHKCAAVDMPAVSFGCDEAFLRAQGKIEAADTWGAARFTPASVLCWTIPSAVMHGPYGIITVGSYAIRETFIHVPFGTQGYRRQDGIVDLPEAVALHSIERGWHASSGGYANYYHWMLDILPKLQIAPFADEVFTGSLIVPPISTAFQQETASLLARCGASMITLAPNEAAAIDQLAFIANMTGAGFAPHPSLSGFFDRFAASLMASASTPRRLYITRAGATRRRLQNETEIAALVQSHGYEICDPAALSMREQIEVFSRATHIVAPHGAGLANIVFCAPGTRLLELQMDGYMNLCFRKLATLRRLRYGCVVGEAITEKPGATSRHAMQWSIEPARIHRALADMDA